MEGAVKKEAMAASSLDTEAATGQELKDGGYTIAATAHAVDSDSWQQVGLLLVIGFNCAYVLSFSNLMMVPLGWGWGVACLLLVGAATWYANWLLAGLHVVDGQRFIRYRDLMGFVFGRKMYYLTWFLQFTTLLLCNMGFILLGARALKAINVEFTRYPAKLQWFIAATGAIYFAFAYLVPTISAMRNWLAASAALTLAFDVALLAVLVKDVRRITISPGPRPRRCSTRWAPSRPSSSATRPDCCRRSSRRSVSRRCATCGGRCCSSTPPAPRCTTASAWPATGRTGRRCPSTSRTSSAGRGGRPCSSTPPRFCRASSPSTCSRCRSTRRWTRGCSGWTRACSPGTTSRADSSRGGSSSASTSSSPLSSRSWATSSTCSDPSRSFRSPSCSPAWSSSRSKRRPPGNGTGSGTGASSCCPRFSASQPLLPLCVSSSTTPGFTTSSQICNGHQANVKWGY